MNKVSKSFTNHWLLIANSVFALIAILILLAPYLSSVDSRLSALLYLLFKPTCHQNSHRCYYIWGQQLPVCARCTGIYGGMLFSGFIYALVRKRINNPLPLVWFVILILPIWIDGLAQTINIWDTGNLWRTITGLLCGTGVVFFVYPYIDERI